VRAAHGLICWELPVLVAPMAAVELVNNALAAITPTNPLNRMLAMFGSLGQAGTYPRLSLKHLVRFKVSFHRNEANYCYNC
jgi:hypothetical protein